jgi:hypothetical protein
MQRPQARAYVGSRIDTQHGGAGQRDRPVRQIHPLPGALHPLQSPPSFPPCPPTRTQASPGAQLQLSRQRCHFDFPVSRWLWLVVRMDVHSLFSHTNTHTCHVPSIQSGYSSCLPLLPTAHDTPGLLMSLYPGSSSWAKGAGPDTGSSCCRSKASATEVEKL